MRYKVVQLEEKIRLQGYILVPATTETDTDEDVKAFEGMLDINNSYDDSEVEIWDEYIIEVEGEEQPELYKTVGWDYVKKHRIQMVAKDICHMYLIDGSVGVWAKSAAIAVKHYHEELNDTVESPLVEFIPDDKPVYLFTDKYGEDKWWFEIYPEEGDKLTEETTVQGFFSQFFRDCDPIIAYGDE